MPSLPSLVVRAAINLSAHTRCSCRWNVLHSQSKHQAEADLANFLGHDLRSQHVVPVVRAHASV